MIRKIIKIDENKCNGCGACAIACHEGAIEILNGKAKLVRENYCDGFGDCLLDCPAEAITFEEREAPAYDEAAVLAAKQKNNHETSSERVSVKSQLGQWPCQIKLVSPAAPYFNNAELLIAADCTAYAYANFHAEYMKDKITLIGCPKLDAVDYSEKLTEIIKNNNIVSISVIRMEVPCCGGLVMAVKKSIESSGKNIPYNVITISVDGKVLKKI